MSAPPIRAVVVDDEPTARAAVLTFLAEVEDIEVVGQAGNGNEAIEVIRSATPDLLFLDVRMPDRDGFEVLEALGDDVPRGVVLVTAHGEFAQRAFDIHAVDYVTKPFGRPRFLAAVNRAMTRLRAEEALTARSTLESLVQSLRLDRDSPADGTLVPDAGPPGSGVRRIGVRMGARTVLVDVGDIDWVEADGDHVRLHVGERIHLLSSTLSRVGHTLGDSGFVRIHRSAIVNLSRVDVLHRDPDGGGSLLLSSGVRLRVARSRWEALEERLGLRP